MCGCVACVRVVGVCRGLTDSPISYNTAGFCTSLIAKLNILPLPLRVSGQNPAPFPRRVHTCASVIKPTSEESRPACGLWPAFDSLPPQMDDMTIRAWPLGRRGVSYLSVKVSGSQVYNRVVSERAYWNMSCFPWEHPSYPAMEAAPFQCQQDWA